MVRGNCYVTCEALYHLLGGKKAGLVPHTVRHENGTHWYLVKRAQVGFETVETVIDPTRAQFATRPPYENGRGRGFLTKKPSKRAIKLMDIMLWQT